jgi:hypothetical protein
MTRRGGGGLRVPIARQKVHELDSDADAGRHVQDARPYDDGSRLVLRKLELELENGVLRERRDGLDA